MPTNGNTGFDSDQLVIFKLGQIESTQVATLNKLEDGIKDLKEDAREAAEKVEEAAKKVDSRLTGHETRLSDLEKSRTRFLAYMAGITAVVTSVVLFFKELILQWILN